MIYLILSTGSGLLVLFTNLDLMEFQVRYLAFFLFFVSIRHLRMVLLGSLHKNAGVPQGSILGHTFFLLHINGLPDDSIYNIAIYADDTTLYFRCDQASDLWQQLKIVSELESDLWDTVDWGKKWLVDFNAGKKLVSFDWSNKQLRLKLFSLNLIDSCFIVTFPKTF